MAIEATFVPHTATGDGWCVIGVAIRESEERCWRLNFVRSPIADGGHRYFELGQMLDGRWPSSAEWRVVHNESAPVAWREDEPLRFRLELTADRMLGEIRDTDGRRRFVREYAFGLARSGAVALRSWRMS